MWMVERLAWGRSTATKSTPLSHQLGDEGDVARQPVELGDHQSGAVQAAQAERPIQLGPVGAPAALDLGHLVGQAPAPAVEVALNRLPLGLQPETGAALTVGADPIIGDKATDRHGLNPPVASLERSFKEL